MDKNKSEFPVGYRKPPRHTRFKPGQSGNPGGRPKKKARTFAESIERELNTWITAHEGGKPRKITKLDAIVKQQTNKSVNGDHKAMALVMKALESRQFDLMDNLSPLLHEMHAIHAKHEISAQKGTREKDTSDVTCNTASDHSQAENDEA